MEHVHFVVFQTLNQIIIASTEEGSMTGEPSNNKIFMESDIMKMKNITTSLLTVAFIILGFLNEAIANEADCLMVEYSSVPIANDYGAVRSNSFCDGTPLPTSGVQLDTGGLLLVLPEDYSSQYRVEVDLPGSTSNERLIITIDRAH